ncbi:MAG TPA: ribosomal protein S18-alanine N-acetyltransferase [Jatrophihabitantaceae bacterium]|jgi:ribosomal-protein-alanine N-acetyltransferase|nr:ribosomal protein S18-alanine N-acetyltransferase [Jatrophihabitantaceae bacterium]
MTSRPAGIDLHIVPMRGDHVTALMQYEREMFGTEAWSASSYRTELADTRHRHYVAAEVGGELAGWAGVMVIGEEAQILTVGVVPSMRRSGIALALVDELIAAAAQRSATEAFLEVRVDNHAARALYERKGFAQIGVRRGYYDGGRIDAVVMRREL